MHGGGQKLTGQSKSEDIFHKTYVSFKIHSYCYSYTVLLSHQTLHISYWEYLWRYIITGQYLL